MSNHGSKLEIGNAKGASGVVGRAEGGMHTRGKGGAPKDRGRGRVSGEPDATHTVLAGVAGAVKRWGRGDQFLNASGPLTEGVCNGAKVLRSIADSLSDADPVAIRETQRVLHGGEEASGTRECKGHGAEFAKELVP